MKLSLPLTLAATSALLACSGTASAAKNNLRTRSHSRDLIVGGRLAAPGAYPSYAYPNSDFQCGGILIHSDIVLTAAHCENNFADNDIRIGLTQESGADAMETIIGETEQTHPDYSGANSLDNDVMLVKLSRPSTAPVAPWNTDANVPTIGQNLRVIGFGSTTRAGSAGSDRLLEVSLPVVDFDTCNAQYNIDDNTQLCAGSQEGFDSCSGDSGGPALLNGIVVGIVSFGPESGSCGEGGIPGVYARLSAYDAWIRRGICELSENPPAYCNQLQ